jgi:DNA gyrase inhibitor GyrI
MTTPVFMSGDTTHLTMAFVLPATLPAASAPKPADGALTVRELPAGRFAVLRFTGRQNVANETESLQGLQAWLEQQRLTAVADPVYGYFDPPWTPPFLRRNEVMLRTKPVE